MEQKQEIEVFGVNYERFAMGNLIRKLCNKLDIDTVAELPAQGTKAMPSIYSLGFGLAGKKVTLINGVEEYKREWEKLNIDKTVCFNKQADILHTDFPDNYFDFVWNCVYIPVEKDPDALIEEMKRVSKKYVAIVTVNRGNVGYHVHTTLHKINDMPWTHGDKQYNKRKFLAHKLEEHGLTIVKRGFVDCPVWPDSLGFRDMRLHRNNIQFDNAAWVSPYTDMLKNNSYPGWMKAMYGWESIPMFPIIKTLYAHLTYVIAEKR
ncbi:MAG: methyltransferase domain-containing protein [Clostridia bacterium]|nr:methyltransferase domain-containing protein [Clostridia bacterium]